MKIRVPVDDLDAIQLAETVASPGHARIRERQQKFLDDRVEALTNAPSWEAATKLQGEIAAIRVCMLIPDILKRQAKEKSKP